MRSLKKLAVLLEAALVGASLHPDGQKALSDAKEWLLGPPEVDPKKKRRKKKPQEKKAEERLVGGKADGVPDSAFDPKSIAKGMKVEREHTTDPELQKEIAKDHLVERPDYYEKLKKYVDKEAAARRGVVSLLRR